MVNVLQPGDDFGVAVHHIVDCGIGYCRFYPQMGSKTNEKKTWKSKCKRSYLNFETKTYILVNTDLYSKHNAMLNCDVNTNCTIRRKRT